MEYCTYITFYRGNKLPPFYIGYSSIKKINKGYNGSVSSKKYKNIWLIERKENIHLFSTKIIKSFNTRKEATIHEEYIHNFLNVHKNSMYINMSIGFAKFNMSESFDNGTHHFQNSEYQTNLNKSRVKKGTHPFVNKEFQKEMSMRAKSKPNYLINLKKNASEFNKKRIEEGTHNFLNNGEFIKQLINEKLSRDNVKVLKKLQKIAKVKLGSNWWRRSDVWINEKIDELNKLNNI